jgi:hypothetical protein
MQGAVLSWNDGVGLVIVSILSRGEQCGGAAEETGREMLAKWFGPGEAQEGWHGELLAAEL